MNPQRRRIRWASIHLLVLLILLLLTVRITFAQSATSEPDTKWWWAWRESTHELIAFDAAGETYVVASGVADARKFERASDDTAFVVLQTGEEYALYKLFAQSALRLNFPKDISLTPIPDSGGAAFTPFSLIQTHLPYAAIGAGSAIWVIDLNTDEIQPLDRSIADKCRSNCVNFSADGHFLRYAAEASPDESDARFVLRERELANGEEHNFYVVYSEPEAKDAEIYCESGAYGENWLCDSTTWFDTNVVYAEQLVNVAGQSRTLMEQSTLPAWNIFFSRDSLILMDRGCVRDCSIEVETQDGTHLQTFKLPPEFTSMDFEDVTPLSNNRLLLHDYMSDSILSLSGQFQDLGYRYCCEAIDTKSPDLHWEILATGEDYSATVWDLETGQAKFVIHDDIWPRPYYSDLGFLILTTSGKQWVYFYDNPSNLLEIAIGSYSTFTDILPNHRLLYEQREDSTDLATGIYRYDMESKTYTPLVPGATFQFGP